LTARCFCGNVRDANDIATKLYREIKAAQNPIDAHVAASAYLEKAKTQ